MVFVCDFDHQDGSLPPFNHHHQFHDASLPKSRRSNPSSTMNDDAASPPPQRPKTNTLNGFSAALSCYPVVLSLARLLDLNSLHNLSRTCVQFRANLLLYRDQLVTRSLRCENEELEPEEDLGLRFREPRIAWALAGGDSPYRMTSGKVGRCARDMVAECRRCGTVVCRNCAAKPPSTSIPSLLGRLRRLCRTCSFAPLEAHALPAVETTTTPRSSPRASPIQLHHLPGDGDAIRTTSSRRQTRSFTHNAFLRSPCLCRNTVHLCAPCGSTLRAADTTYARGCSWRTKYCSYLGGLGTGIAEGNKGVECGRRATCLAARLVEQEIDCGVLELQALELEAEKVAAEGTGRSWSGSSFAAQEMEGVGGVVKMKVKRLVKVGAEVEELEDEEIGSGSGSGESGADVGGEARSWCAWCERVVPGGEEWWDEEWEMGGS